MEKKNFLRRNICIARKNLELSQTQFAANLGITRAALGAYEEGRATPPIENIIRIAEYLEVTLDTLVLIDWFESAPEEPKSLEYRISQIEARLAALSGTEQELKQ